MANTHTYNEQRNGEKNIDIDKMPLNGAKHERDITEGGG